MRVERLADISAGRTGGRVGVRHASITHGSQYHGEHSNEDRGGDVAMRHGSHYAKRRQRGRRLNDDYAVDEEVPKREYASDAARSFCRGDCRHRAAALAGVSLMVCICDPSRCTVTLPPSTASGAKSVST